MIILKVTKTGFHPLFTTGVGEAPESVLGLSHLLIRMKVNTNIIYF